MSLETKQLHALSRIYKEAVYGGAKKKSTDMVVTNADKKANTPAYKNLKAGVKGYKAADHLTNEEFVDEKVATGPRLGEPRAKGATHMNAGEGRKIQKRTKDWMDKKGLTGSPGGDAMKEREAEHRARDEKGKKAAAKKRGLKKAKKDYDGDGKIESGKAEYFGSKDKAIKKAMGKKIKEGMSNWRQDLKEIPDYDQIPLNDKKRNAKIEQKDNVNNIVKINPEMKEEFEIIEAYADELSESDIADILARLEKKRISKGGDPDESPLGKKTGRAMKSQQDKARKKAGLKTEDVEIEEGVYEKQKTKEVMGALKKRDLKQDVKKKIAADIVKKKGDTSKSDDRYAYEGYQRDPEGGEEKERKAKRERKGGYDEKRERRMNDPKKGINSPAFQEFMRSRGM